MKSWTRTLNLDDAHTLLALAEPGMALSEWTDTCYGRLPHLSVPRQRELIRMIRDGFLTIDGDGRIADGAFLRTYAQASALGQIDMMAYQWALSHPLTLIAVEELIAPALRRQVFEIPLADVEALVAAHIDTSSAESLRKTRTVLLGALEGIGVLETRGTGQYRSLRATHGHPHPISFGYLVMRDLIARDEEAMMASEVSASSLGVRLTQCTPEHARMCVAWNLEHGILWQDHDEIGAAA